MKEFTHIMLDLETMGNRSNSAIVSIAAVPFNLETGAISNDYFYQKVDLQSCLDVGLKVQASTIYWWMRQSEEARKELYKSDTPPENIHKALNDLQTFFHEFNMDVEVWGNGARFDMGLLEDAYHACKYYDLPWDFRKERDVRTLVSLAPHIKKQTPNLGTAHNPVDDCIFQINYCCAIYQYLNNKPQQHIEINSQVPFNVDTPCDVCGCHPNVIVTTHKGTFCLEHVQY